jgi:hypothetical protein
MRRAFYYTNEKGNRVGSNCAWFVRHALNEALLYRDMTMLNIAIEHKLPELFDHPEDLKTIMAGGIVKNGRPSVHFDKEQTERNKDIWKRLHYWRGYGKTVDPSKPLPINSNGPEDACNRVHEELQILTPNQIFKIYQRMKKTVSGKDGAGAAVAWFYEGRGRVDRAEMEKKKGEKKD